MSGKEPMPGNLRALAIAAKQRTEKRGSSAPIADVLPAKPDTDLLASSPYADEDWELWAYLLTDTFGTRNLFVAHAFMRQLAQLCPEHFSEGQMVLDTGTFQQALCIVASLKPDNEAEAAMAVMAVQLNFAMLKVSDHMRSRSWLEPRTGGALAAIAKTYALLVKSMRESRSPNKPKRQVIKVQKNVTVNYRDEKHVHLPGGGGRESGGQPYAPTQLRAHATPEGCAALPSPNASGQVLPWPGGEGQAGLPNARSQRRCAQGREER